MTCKSTSELIADCWDKRTLAKEPSRFRWWNSDRIIRHVNKIVCGKDVPGVSQGAVQLLKSMVHGKSFDRGLSIGCGKAFKEIRLLKLGIVKTFDLYELSHESVNVAQSAIDKHGLTERVNIYNDDFFRSTPVRKYDFVHWDNSLHHMFDCDKAIAETYALLTNNGVFFMNDFVGSSRFQWSDQELEIINSFRSCFPDYVFRLPGGLVVDRIVLRPDLDAMISKDPSEAADSDSIIPSLKKRTRNPRIIFTGGTIYHSGLNDILSNISENSPLLSRALEIDQSVSIQGINQYAVCISIK